MQQLKHILFLSNPTINQDAAIRQVKQLCETSNAKLTLMDVVPQINPIWQKYQESLGDIEGQITKQMRNELESLEADFRKHGIDVESHLTEGRAHEEVIARVKEAAIDLVVVNAHHGQSLKQAFFGSTALHLIRKCPCPVLAVRSGNRQPPKRIMAAIDLTTDTGFETNRRSMNPDILRSAQYLGEQLNMQLHVVQAWQLENEGYLQLRGGLEDNVMEAMMKDMRAEFVSITDNYCSEHLSQPLPPGQRHVVHGHAAHVIASQSQIHEIDLLVMGTVSRHGLKGLLIGNTAEEILSVTDCSVLVLKPKEA